MCNCKNKTCDCRHSHENGHSCNCRYKNGDKILYAAMQLNDQKILISANEVNWFDALLESAKNDDAGIVFDEDCESMSYKIVYGGIMFRHTEHIDEVIANLTENKGCSFMDLDSFDGETVKESIIADFVIGDATTETQYRPFVALMQTETTLHDSDISTTFIPSTGGLIWEDMVNKSFLIAARETVELDGLTLENWRKKIDKDLMNKYFEIADKYTATEDDDKTYFTN